MTFIDIVDQGPNLRTFLWAVNYPCVIWVRISVGRDPVSLNLDPQLWFRIRIQSDPVFEMSSDLDPVFKIWWDPDPVSTAINLKLNFSCISDNVV